MAWPDRLRPAVPNRLSAVMLGGFTRVGLIGYRPTGPEPLSWQFCRRRVGVLTIALVLLAAGGLAIAAAPADHPDLRSAGVVVVVCALVLAAAPMQSMHPAWFSGGLVLLLTPWTAAALALGPDAGQISAFLVFVVPAVGFLFASERGWVLGIGPVVAVVAAIIAFAGVSRGSALELLVGLGCGLGLTLLGLILWRMVAEQGAMLEQFVRRDALTGLGNRRMLRERLDYELRRHGRSGRPVSVLVLDLNGFKQVNDHLGHGAGDDLLRAVAAALRATLRRQDGITRPGGDEFCIVAPETAATDCDRLMGTIRAALGRLSAHDGPVSVAIGAATFPQDGVTADDLLAVADARQRDDKAQGSPLDGTAASARLAVSPAGVRGAESPPVAPAVAEPPASPGDAEYVPLRRRLLRERRFRFAVAGLYGLGAVVAAAGAWWMDEPLLLIMVPVTLALGLLAAVTPTDRIPGWMFALGPPAIIATDALALMLAGDAWIVVTPFVVFVGAAIGVMVETWRARVLQVALAVAVMLVPLVLWQADGAGVVVVATLAGLLSLAAVMSVSWVVVERQAHELGWLMRRDPLTGLGNRRLLDERLAYELVRHGRDGGSLALLVLDLNDFKSVNDELGHPAGDQVLRDAAAALRRAARRQDTIVRHGGDEFGVLVPGAGRPEAERISAHIREALRDVDAGGRDLAGAVGFAVFPEDARDGAKLVEIADARQRSDKGSGSLAARRAPGNGQTVR